MASVVIDTDVLSFLFKQDNRGDLYKPHIDGKLGVISFMTVAELDFWADSRKLGSEATGATRALHSAFHRDRF